MDFSHNDVCDNNDLLCSDQWGTQRKNYSLEGSPAGRSHFFIPIPSLCRGFDYHVEEGVAVCRDAPRISHLLFADDSIIFCRTTAEEGSRVLKVLADYEGDSSQKLKKEKTSLFFSKNTRREVQEQVKSQFGAQIIKHHERYLGLLPLIGKGKKKAFNRIKDLVGRKMVRWKGKLLSNVGREILIKVVAQAIPTYTMSCFKLLDSLCKELNSMMSNSWWGQKEKKRKMTWIS